MEITAPLPLLRKICFENKSTKRNMVLSDAVKIGHYRKVNEFSS